MSGALPEETAEIEAFGERLIVDICAVYVGATRQPVGNEIVVSLRALLSSGLAEFTDVICLQLEKRLTSLEKRLTSS